MCRRYSNDDGRAETEHTRPQSRAHTSHFGSRSSKMPPSPSHESQPGQPLPVAQLPDEAAPSCQLVEDRHQAILARWRSFFKQLHLRQCRFIWGHMEDLKLKWMLLIYTLEVGGVSPTGKSFRFVRACERARRGEAAWASERRRFAPVVRVRRGKTSSPSPSSKTC